MNGVASEPTSEESASPHRRRRWWIAIGILGLVLILALAFALSWHFSSVVLTPDHSPYSEEVDIKAVSRNRITLARSETSERPGYYGLAWQAGHAIVGPVESDSSENVTRKLTDVQGYLVADAEAGFETNVYAGNPRQGRGLPFRTVNIPDPLGPMPAWQIPATRRQSGSQASTWAIVVHGHNDDRESGLRIAPALRRAGLPTLLISYRNDLGAPASPDDHYHLGETEWQDLGAAARYALQHGANHLVLTGYSMGGAVIEQFLQRSPLANRVSGVILDAPVFNWKSVIEFNAEQMSLPGALALPVEWVIDARISPDWNNLNALQHPEDFQMPVLLFHGTDDSVVPIRDSDEFAEELGKSVTYYRVPRADHTQAWNVDPRLYEQRVGRFLLQIGLNRAAGRAQKQNEPDRRGSGSNE